MEVDFVNFFNVINLPLFLGATWTFWLRPSPHGQFRPVKEILLRLLTVMLLLQAVMLWQRLFMLGCLIGMMATANMTDITYICIFWWTPFMIVVNLSSDNVLCCRLVEKINRSVGQDLNSRMQIGVLDIYGFECFKHNRSSHIISDYFLFICC